MTFKTESIGPAAETNDADLSLGFSLIQSDGRSAVGKWMRTIIP